MRNLKLAFAEGWGFWSIVAVTAITIISVIFFYRRVQGTVARRDMVKLLALRIIAMVALLLCIFRPAFSYQKSLMEHLSVLFLIDTSKSMGIRDFPNLPDRLNRVKNAVLNTTGFVSKIEKDYDTAWYNFFATATSLAAKGGVKKLEATGTATDIGTGVQTCVGARRKGEIGGIILFSDGIDNSGSDVIGRCAALGVPVYTVGVGTNLREQKNFKDIAVQKVECKMNLAAKITADVTVYVDSISYQDRVVPVVLKQDGKEVGRENVVLDSTHGGQKVTIRFKPEKVGQYVLEASIEPDAAERIKENNTATIPIVVTEPKLRVLYIEGTLRWEYKFLHRTLEYDPNIQILSLVKTGEDLFYQQGSIPDVQLTGFPKTKEDLDKFNVLIIGDLDRAHLTNPQLEMIRNFVNEGGGLLMLGGYNSFGPGGYGGTPVEEVLPVVCGDKSIGQEKRPFLLKVTAEGTTHPIFAGCESFFMAGKDSGAPVPQLLGCVVVARVKPGASVLAVDPDVKSGKQLLPVVVVQQVGKGRSAAVTADTTWRWEFQLRGMGKETPYFKFWGQMVRWLANQEGAKKSNEPGVFAYLDRAFYQPGDKMRLFARVNDDQGQAAKNAHVTAVINGPRTKGEKLEVPAAPTGIGEFTTEFDRRDPGKYTMDVEAGVEGKVLGKASLKFEIAEPIHEFDKLDIDEDMLKKIADNTGGRYFSIINVEQVADVLEQRLNEKSLHIEFPLWNGPLFFLLFIGLITGEWLLRKARQLS